MSTAKDGIDLINDAIDASIKFEELMDSIDFNSYFEKKYKPLKITNDSGIDICNKQIKKASECFSKVLNKISDNIKDDKFKPSDESSEFLIIQWLIFKLLIAKENRLDAKKQTERKKELEKYLNIKTNLHKALDIIPQNSNYEKLIDPYNLEHILYFNELAICYSGLAESSMSFGYAGQSIFLLEKLYPDLKYIEDMKPGKRKQLKEKIDKKEKPITFSKIIRLYTFALFNKGEAERLLGNENSALKTFQRIIDIYKSFNWKKNLSDYYSSLHRKEMLLIDMGRGIEAEKTLLKISKRKKVDIFFEDDQIKDILKDTRLIDGILEIASSYIDGKEYKKAYKILKRFSNNKFNYTSAQRKANVYMLRLLNEFKKNRPEDFSKSVELTKFDSWDKIKSFPGIYFDKKKEELTVTLEMDEKVKKNIINKLNTEKKINKIAIKRLLEDFYPNEFPKLYGIVDDIISKILEESIILRDGSNFKRMCVYLAEYFCNKDGKIGGYKNFEKALKFSYFYLFYKTFFEDGPKIKNKSDKNIFNDWIKNDKTLSKLFSCSVYSKYKFCNILDSVEDEKYLKGFFDIYVNACIKDELVEENKTNQVKEKDKYELSENEKNIVDDIVKKLEDRLEKIYIQKKNDIELEHVEEKYELFKKKYKYLGKRKIRKGGEPEKFIEDYFFKNIGKWMESESIVDQMKRNTEKFVRKVVGRSKIHNGKKGEIEGILSVLRRWNSFTPTLSSSVNPSKGGGYFLHFSYNDESLGIVIDPGYDFLENFFFQGFKIGDIDAVLVSHTHPDHTDNLPSILSLFHEMNERLGEYHYSKDENKKNLTLIVSPGVFDHYSNIIKTSEDVLKNIIVVHVTGKEKEPKQSYEFITNDKKIKIEIKAFGTSHQDLSEFQSLGFQINVNKNSSKTIIGYTGDAKWNPNKWPKYLKECDVICAHLGSIINILNKKDFCNTFCQKHDKECNDVEYREKCKKSQFDNVNVTKNKSLEQIQEENHLYLAGLASFFNPFLKKGHNLKLGIISEFGEEFKYGIRMDIYNKLNAWFKNNGNESSENIRFLPGDIGLEVDVFKGNVRCHCCNRFVERNKIEPIAYGEEEAICFVCKECKKVLSSYQIGEKLKEICENGRKLELADEYK